MSTVISEYGVLVALLLIVVGVINLTPGVAFVFGEARLGASYGVSLNDQNLVVLLRHRAVLLGIIGALLIAAVLLGTDLWLPVTAAAVSMASFAAIVLVGSDLNSRLHQVAIIDVIGCLLLAVAVILMVVRGV